MKEKSRECYQNLLQERKDKIKEYQRKRYQELVQHKKEALKNIFKKIYFIKKFLKKLNFKKINLFLKKFFVLRIV